MHGSVHGVVYGIGEVGLGVGGGLDGEGEELVGGVSCERGKLFKPVLKPV